MMPGNFAIPAPNAYRPRFAGVGWREELDDAFEWLERAYRQKDSSLIGIVNDPLWADIADDPRFQTFLRDRLKLPDEAIRRLTR